MTLLGLTLIQSPHFYDTDNFISPYDGTISQATGNAITRNGISDGFSIARLRNPSEVMISSQLTVSGAECSSRELHRLHLFGATLLNNLMRARRVFKNTTLILCLAPHFGHLPVNRCILLLSFYYIILWPSICWRASGR